MAADLPERSFDTTYMGAQSIKPKPSRGSGGDDEPEQDPDDTEE
jgi:hypothetical protein